MWVPPEDVPEEGGAGRENHLVSLQLLIFTCQSHVKEVFVVTQLSECNTNVGLEVIPTETKLFTTHSGILTQLLRIRVEHL